MSDAKKNLLVRRIFRAPSYVRAFGWLGGLNLLQRIERALPHHSERVRQFLVPGYNDPFYLRDSVADHATFRQCLVMQQYDFRTFPQFARFDLAYREALKHGQRPLILDGGANVGLGTRWFAKHFPEAQIIAVEPDQANFALLQRNTAPLKNRVMCLRGALWDKPGFLKISNPTAGSTAYRVEEVSSDAGGIRAFTIPELFEMSKGAVPFVVKLDIEGSQATVFRSNTDWVRLPHLISLELDDWLLPWSGCNRSFFACLGPQPFDYLIKDESIFCFRHFVSDQ